ncbi:MAG: PQQ-binding-like beta-propeller repeat protein [Azospirillaceae bacterium]
MRARSLRVGLIAAACAIGLSACGTGGWFGEEEDPPLPGERVSVLELEGRVEPDPQVSTRPVTVPPARSVADWPQAGGQPSHVNGNLALDLPLSRVWQSDIGTGESSNRRLTSPPVVAGGTLYAMDASGHVTAIDADNGRRRWRVRAATPDEDSVPLGGGVAVAEGLVYASTGFGEVMALDPANGGLVWRTEVSAPLRAPPTVAQGRVFAVTVDNQTEALDAANGQPLWTHSGLLETAGLLGGAAPAAGPGIVVTPYTSGEIYALRQESGRPTWSDSLAAIRRVGVLAALADIRGMPALDDQLVVAISHSGRMVAIDLRSGARVWEQDLAGIEMPWIAGDFVYVVTTSAELVALTRQEGAIRWVTPLPRWEDPEERAGAIVWQGPVMAGGQLVVASSTGDGLVVDPSSGEVAGRFDIPGPAVTAPIVAGGTLYVLDASGTVTAYR